MKRTSDTKVDVKPALYRALYRLMGQSEDGVTTEEVRAGKVSRLINVLHEDRRQGLPTLALAYHVRMDVAIPALDLPGMDVGGLGFGTEEPKGAWFAMKFSKKGVLEHASIKAS